MQQRVLTFFALEKKIDLSRLFQEGLRRCVDVFSYALECLTAYVKLIAISNFFRRQMQFNKYTIICKFFFEK